MKKYKVKWFRFFSRGQHPVLINDLCWQAFHIQPKITGLPKLNFYKRDVESTYFDRDEFDKLSNILANRLNANPQEILAIIKKAEKSFQQVIHLAEQYNSIDWQMVDDENLIKKLTIFLDHLIPLFCFIYYPLWLEQGGTNLLDRLLNNIPSQKREKIIWQITRPIKQTTREKFNLELLQLACQLQKKDKFIDKSERIKKIIKNFATLPAYLLNIKEYTPDDIKSELGEFLDKNPCQEKEEKITHFQKQCQIRKSLLREFDIKIQRIAEILSNDVWLREERIVWYGKIFTHVHSLFCEMARRKGLTYQEFVQQTVSEIRSNQINPTVLKERLKGYTYFVENGQVNITLPITGEKTQSQAKIIHGQVANSGKVRGKVRIGNAYTFSQILPGEIVVTGMTTPESVMYVRKAAAIITDEGGITCHAAIISRELGIPCIIGTKIATKILKDGDHVEVDANRGIIKKLT